MNRYRYRQVILFLFVLLLPSVAIVVLTRRITTDDYNNQFVQEKQRFDNETKQADAAMESAAADIGSDFQAELELIKYRAPETYSNPAVAMVGWLEGEHLVWPWDQPTDEAMGLRLKQDNSYAQKMEDARLADNNSAADIYRAILAE